MHAWRPTAPKGPPAGPADIKPAATRRPVPAAALSQAELRLLAKLEGRPLPRGQALAQTLGITPRAAWKLVVRLRRESVLRFASGVRLRPETCDCVSDLKVDWSRLAEPEVLEAELRRDPAIVTADRVAGACDYRLASRHRDYRAAAAWDRRLAGLPGVAEVRTRFCGKVADRPRYAAIRLALEGAAGE